MNTSKYLALILSLSIALPSQAQDAPRVAAASPKVLLEGSSLDLPILSTKGDSLDTLKVHVFEVTKPNEVLDLKPYIIEAQELPAADAKFSVSRILKNSFSKENLTGLAFSVTSSSMGFLGLYYVAGVDLTSSAIIGTTMFSIATFQALFTNYWQSYLQKGLFIKNFLGLFNKKLLDNELVKSIGNISAAAVFNIAPTAVALSLTGQYHSFTSAALTGALGAYDYTVDIAAGKLSRRERLSEKNMKKIVRYRLLAGPILEMFSLSGNTSAQYAMATIGTLGIVAIIRGEKLADDIERLGRIVRWNEANPSCSSLLNNKPRHIRAFDDVG